MASVNKVILVGRLGADPEVRFGSDGTTFADLSVATDFRWNDKGTGEKKQETEWHRVSLSKQQAQYAGEYAKKGMLAYVEGRMRTRKWKDKSGQDRYTTEIVADKFNLLSGRAGDDAQKPQASTAGPTGTTAAPSANKPDDFEEDIPY